MSARTPVDPLLDVVGAIRRLDYFAVENIIVRRLSNRHSANVVRSTIDDGVRSGMLDDRDGRLHLTEHWCG